MNTEFQDTAMNIDDQAWNGDWCLANSDPKAEFQAGAEPTPARRKRAPVACRRCRRLRSKCVHENADPPCELCRAAGSATAAACVFASRGRGDRFKQLQGDDREYRQRRRDLASADERDTLSSILVATEHLPRIRQTLVDCSPKPPRIILNTRQETLTETSDTWSVLPPLAEVLEGCRTFFTSCFQLGFLPKAIFLERLATDKESISVFLLLGILSVSARFTRCLLDRYGDATKATDYFISRACDLMPNEIFEPNIERTQALFLLGVAEWVQGNRTRSAIHLGIAVRMASMQHLHREESYVIPQNPTTEDIINSEVARRTFWVLESQDHLYSEHNAAVSFPLSDITALLPSDEADFAYGTIPAQRAALGGTKAAMKNPDLVSLQSRSPFATLVQVHVYWGEIARRAGRATRSEREKADQDIKPWEENSEYSQLTRSLKEWEEKVPPRHRWSLINLRGHKAEGLDLAYLSQVMVVRINNIVIRRIYLEDILESKLGTSSPEYSMPNFWTQMSHELFENVYSLHESFDTWFSLRSPDEGIPSIVVFCVYICGSLASCLWKWPQLCPELAKGAEAIFNRSLEVLAALIDRLPRVSKWLNALKNLAVPLGSRGDILQSNNGVPASSARAFTASDLQKDGVNPVPVSRGLGTQPARAMAMMLTEPVLHVRDDSSTNTGERSMHTERALDSLPPIPDFGDMGWTIDSSNQCGDNINTPSFDFQSAYSFDEELTRLLQGEM